MGKISSAIQDVVNLTKWCRRRLKASSTAPSDVPRGHLAVIVGCDRRRFVMRATQLNHPAFSGLLDAAEEEYGFNYADGPVSFPCDESAFLDALRLSAAPSC